RHTRSYGDWSSDVCSSDLFLGGEIKVSVERARAALERIAGPLDVDVEEAALGVIRIANANMVNALKLVSVRRGYDPRDFDMVARSEERSVGKEGHSVWE